MTAHIDAVNTRLQEIERKLNLQSVQINNAKHTAECAMSAANDILSDLIDLLEFLEANPGLNVVEWVRYERVKQKLAEGLKHGPVQV